MPLFGWVRWPRHKPCPAARRAGSEAVARTLLRELQWHLKERERFVQEVDHGARAGGDDTWLRTYQNPHTTIPATEQRQLEALCSRVQPCQAGAILSRFREVLAEHDVLPWEIVYIFKQVLEDALGGPEKGGQPGLAAGGVGGPTHPACPGDSARSSDQDEIPTVSSYVERHAENRLPTFSCRTWDLPYHQPPR
ncbi:protein RD3-like [Eptesicus fuscus]|uniref:protein RD3-like n=1 Tax=Eptesicus fuscus TaxID=29078 RepID=UPI002403BE17|nr:protein RD3-like [Eptesicus fuscus]